MSVSASDVRSAVADYLAELGVVGIDGDGDFSLRHGSARIFVRVTQDDPDGAAIISVFTPILVDVPTSADLVDYVAFDDSILIGRLVLVREDDGTISVVMVRRLLGDYFEKDELQATVIFMANTADDIDDPLQRRFGGRRFHED